MKKIILVLTLIFVMAASVYAETTVNRISIATGIKNLEPVDEAKEFKAEYRRLYCFTEITTQDYPTEVTHIWIYDKKIVAEVPLKVNSPKWRTYSSKVILDNWVGSWKIEVYSKNGKLIDSIDFKVNE